MRNSPANPRDSQKRRAQIAQFAYSAEQKQFATLDEIQTYLDKAIRTKWFRRRWPGIAELGMVVKPLYFKRALKSDWAFEQKTLRRVNYHGTLFPLIYFPYHQVASLFPTDSDWNSIYLSWNELMVWHLVAHHCANSEVHGREWAGAFLRLVRKFMGPAAHFILREKFRKYKVHYVRRKNLTPEQRAAKRASMKPEFIERRRHLVRPAKSN